MNPRPLFFAALFAASGCGETVTYGDAWPKPLPLEDSIRTQVEVRLDRLEARVRDLKDAK